MVRRGRRVLAAVLFTDIVGSSALAGDLGDRRWKELIARHHVIVRRELKQHGGRELDTAGDGFFASFNEPAAAIRCAASIAEAIRRLGIEVRAGVHFGEAEQVGGKLAGLTVVVAARVMSLGTAGDVLVTDTTRELAGGAGFEFEDRGRHRLKGLDREWHVNAVTSVDGEVRSAPLDAVEAEALREGIRPPPRLLPGRRRIVVAAVALAPVSVAAGIFLVLLFSRDSSETVEVAPDSIVRVDPTSGAVVEGIRVGADPRAVLVTDRFVWAARTRSEIVERIDPDTGQTDSISATGHPTALTADDRGRIWVLNGFDGTLDRIHPSQLRVELTIDDLPSQTGDVAFGESAVWVTDTLGRSLIKVDPIAGAWTAFALGEFEPTSVAAGSGAVWITSGASLLRVGPSDGAVLDQFTLRSPGDDVAVGVDAVWVVHPTTDQVTRVDIGSETSRSVDVGNQPQSVATFETGAWVADHLDGTLTQLDGDGFPSRTIHLGGRPFAVGAGPSGVWATIV